MKKAKASKRREFVFKMNAYSVKTLPMNRLAEYMSDLATVFGEHKHVHFHQIRAGSVALSFDVDIEAEAKVRNRIRQSKRGEGPTDAVKAIRNINIRLADDNASADLFGPNDRMIIPFPGRKQFRDAVIGPIKQQSVLDGVPIRVGGPSKTVPVHLQDYEGKIHICRAGRGIARDIAKYISRMGPRRPPAQAVRAGAPVID